MPLAIAARRVLGVRLRAVARHLPLAVNRAHQDVEHVHQLRVATRRCRAALDLFRDALPPKDFRRLRKELRRLRRAAGNARDADVFLLSLTDKFATALPGQLAGLHWLVGQLACARGEAQLELRETTALVEFQGLAKSVLASARAPGEGTGVPQTLIELGRSRLLQLLGRLEELGHGDLNNPEHLHAIRIEGKRLRYTLEVLADCLPAEYRKELYPRVEEMQEILGAINDGHVALARVATMRRTARFFSPTLYRDWRPGIDALARWHRERLGSERLRFATFWHEWQQAKVHKQFGELLEQRSG